MSIYGLMSSNGKTGLGWEDRNTYTGEGGGMQMDEDGGFMWNFTGDDDDGGGGDWGGRGNTPEGIAKPGLAVHIMPINGMTVSNI